ncbi:hypothetical protein TH53_12755 [Pedobacter lusitanus]|uniref:Uncharacterized protein n=1 Tax=Pedobacter lusitanus TaxID=1503925 RepID=A0A0D0FWD9_9SPHI|nr:hypothetical protein [Pedobacter lusitanus]KIO76789.1 hypothetical protein TH53_12755 [Pedobacter lusitanus]
MRITIPKTISVILITMTCLILFFGACKKDGTNSKKNPGTNEINIQDAKDYFYNSVLKNTDGKITSSDSKPTNSDEIPNALWDYASKKGDALRVPLKFDSKLKYKIEGTTRTYSFDQLTYLLFYKNKEDKFEVEKVITMPDKEYVNNTSKEKKFSGLVVIEDWYGNLKKIFQYKGGLYRKLVIPSRTNPNRTVVNGLGDGGCVYISGGFACVGAGGGQTCTERPGRYYCPGGGNDGAWGPETGPRGNPEDERSDPTGFDGGAGPDPTPEKKDIIDSLQNYPCAQELLTQLPLLKNDIASLINTTFNGSCDMQIKFIPASFPSTTGGGFTDGDQIVTDISPKNGYNFDAGFTMSSTIRINQDVLSYATKEYILVTMYHEALHAYLSAEKLRLGRSFATEYPDVNLEYVNINGTKFDFTKNIFVSDHSRMGLNFYTQLANTIKLYNPNLPEATVNAMAAAGIFNTSNNQKLLNENERDTRKNNQTGSKCQ